MPRAYVLVNRRARKLRADTSTLLAQCRARATLKVLETFSLDDLADAARVVAADPAPVVIAGGDGSHGAGVTALAHAMGELPPIGLLRGGTVNTVARGWHVASARRLLDAVEAGAAASTRRPTLRVSSRLLNVPHPERVAFIVGAGLVARFFEVYDGRGLASAARVVARVFAGSFVGGDLARRVLDPEECEVEVDGVRAPFARISLACASVVADVGLGLRLLYRADSAPAGGFHVVATPLGPRALGPQMPRVLAGKPLRGPRVDALAEAFTLRFPAGSGAYVVDGELVRADHVEVRAGPSLDVIQAS